MGRAVVFGDEVLSYGEFDERVNRFARYLIGLGVGPESLVGLAVRRSVDLLVGLYAIVRAGGAWVPLDPDAPSSRNEYVLDSADPVCVVSTERDGFVASGRRVVCVDVVDVSGFSGARVSDVDRRSPLRASNTAYVIFTSGSTGRPKGVAVSHAAIVNQLEFMQGEYRLMSSDVYLQKTATTFDVSLWGFFMPLRVGAVLVLASADGHRDPGYLASVIDEQGVSVTDFVPTMLSTFSSLVDPGLLGSLRDVLVIGEALPVEAVREFGLVSSARLHNLYGPTEAAVSFTFADVTAAGSGSVVSIGVPEWNCRVFVLDSRLRPVAVGVAGELYLSGVQLARGYVGRPDLSADRFVASPFGSGERMYRTGDLVRWNSIGELEYIGRTDFQVKFRGQRIELGEIEAALVSHGSVLSAAVVVRGSVMGDQLVGYVVPAVGSVVDVSVLRGFVGERVPGYMVPAAVVVLDAFPLNSSGKLDRALLPEPVFEARVFRAPVSSVELVVASAFVGVLGVDRVGLDDDFFELGGNSLIATRVVMRIAEELETAVPVRLLFEASTVQELAARLESHVGEGSRLALTAQDRPEEIPLSLAQQRMWFLNRFDGSAGAYNMPFALRLSGELDLGAMRAAIGDVVARHETLRTVYPETDSGPVQVIEPVGHTPVELNVESVTEAEIVGKLVELASTRFDVTAEIPLRIRLFQVAENEYVLAVVVHHIAADGSSTTPFARDLVMAYAARAQGTAPGWAPLDVQYADYSLWQREVLGSEEDPESVSSEQIAYWSQALAGLPDQLDLPTDRLRPAAQSYRGGYLQFEIDATVHQGLSALAREHGTTLFMVTHAAFAILLARLSGTDDIAVGTPIAGRGERALDDLIGMFVNTLVFRTHVDGSDSFTELLARVRENDLQAFAHADVPFERLVEVLNPARSTARHPLYQVGFLFQNMEQASLELPGLTVKGLEIDNGVAQFDLQLIVGDNYDERGVASGISAVFSYAHDLFDESTVQSFADRFNTVLAAVVADPSIVVGDIDVLDPRESNQVLQEWNATEQVLDAEATLVDLFDQQVAAHGDSVALVHGLESLTYVEFDDKVNRLARHLIELGVGPESLVALGMRRSIDLVIGMYAVAKAGGGYVPIDPDHPADRTGYVLEMAAPVCVLSNENDAPSLAGIDNVLLIDTLDLSRVSGAPVRGDERTAPLRSANTAYVIFTSGSTGKPKGVALSHAAIVNQLLWKRDRYGLDQTDAMLLKTAATFDLSVWEFWSALTSGSRLVIADPDGHKDAEYMLALIAQEKVTTLHAVPSMLSMLTAAADGTLPQSLERVLAIGEALPAATAAEFRKMSDAALVNLYGPTEAAVSVTAHDVDESDTSSVSIGAPEWNTQVYVLDERLHPVPVGVTGELYLAGTQLARGYHGRADLTSERFVANTFGEPGTRLYRTGDLVVWRSGGELEYVDRADFQVKIRGYRIELGEIEAVIRAAESVDAAVVVAKTDPRLGDRLVGYLVPQAGATVDVDSVKAELVRELPSYMVPSALMVLSELPLNINGKIDRKALPEPEFEATEFRAPSNPVEEIVASVFAEVLGVPRVGLDDDFFDLGGNSLIATQVVARLGQALDAQIPVRIIFEASTVGLLASRVLEHAGSGSRAQLVAQERPSQIPLSLAQQRMWVLNQIDRRSAAYNIPVAIRMSGDLDVAALQSAVSDLVARHEILRTFYPDLGDGPTQSIQSKSAAVVDMAVLYVGEDTIGAEVAKVVGQGFDVTAGVPLRVRLFQITPTEHVLIVVVHHISGDAFSMAPMIRDTMVAYTARTGGAAPEWAPLEVQYADYTLWQRDVLGSEGDPDSELSTQLAYWTQELAGVPELLELPTDRPRPPTQSMKGADFLFTLGADSTRRIAEIAREQNSTVFMVVHAAFSVLLSKLSGSNDIAIGTPVAGRGERVLDDLVGMFVNTLVLRTQVKPATTFVDLLQQVKEKDLAAFGNADVPFERLVEQVGRERSQAYSPLFQVMLTFQNMALGTFALPGLELSAVDDGFDSAMFDLQLTGIEEFDEHGALSDIRMRFTYATDLYDAATMELFATRLRAVVDAVAADPTVVLRTIDIVTDFERALIEAAEPKTAADLPDLAAAAAAADPTAVAFTHGDTVVTFTQLAEKLAVMKQTMGAALTADALVSVSLNGLVPGILPALGADGITSLVESLITDAQATLGKGSGTDG